MSNVKDRSEDSVEFGDLGHDMYLIIYVMNACDFCAFILILSFYMFCLGVRKDNDSKAPFIVTQLNSTQLNCQLSIRRRRVGGSERLDPVEVVCGS